MKKIISILMVITLTLTLSGCCCMPGMFDDTTTGGGTVAGNGGYTDYETESEVEYFIEESQSQSSASSSQSESTSSVTQPKPQTPDLSPEAMVDIYMANKNVWMENPDYPPMAGYGYCLLDLDFDGVLELICNLVDGTGRFSCNSYYRIDVNSKSVLPITSSIENRGDGYDYIMVQDTPRLLKNKSTGKKFYYCGNFVRVTMSDYGTSYGTMHMSGGTIQGEYLFDEFISGGANSYGYYLNGQSTDVSQAEYNQKTNEFFAQHDDLNLKWEKIYGDTFDKADATTQKQLLLNAYKAFSYNGFSF